MREIHFCEKLLVLASSALSLANYCREALPRYRLAMQSVRIRSAGADAVQ